MENNRQCHNLKIYHNMDESLAESSLNSFVDKTFTEFLQINFLQIKVSSCGAHVSI